MVDVLLLRADDHAGLHDDKAMSADGLRRRATRM